MPKSKTVEATARSAEKKRLRNKSVKSATATRVVRAEKLISNNELEPAQEAVTTAISALDKAAKKGVIHRNTAARRKSRLMKKLNKAKLSSATGQKKTTRAKAA